MPDKYDDAIEWLVANPGKCEPAWCCPSPAYPSESDCAHCLFQYVTPSGDIDEDRSDCGCLTQIARRDDPLEAWTEELTLAIRADSRIRSTESLDRLRGDDLRAALQPFAEWQRRLDREIRGVTQAGAAQ